jgi:hypothetical protein
MALLVTTLDVLTPRVPCSILNEPFSIPATIYNFINSGTKSNDETQVVQELDDSSFDSVVSSHPYVLVDFFAPW